MIARKNFRVNFMADETWPLAYLKNTFRSAIVAENRLEIT